MIISPTLEPRCTASGYDHTFRGHWISADSDPQVRRVQALADDIIAAPEPYYETPPARRYLLPCHLLFYGGLYEYVLIDVPAARRWLLAGPCMSFLTHPMLHAAFQDLIGFLTPPPERGPLPALGFHDDALCFIVQGYETLPDLRRGDSKAIRRLVEEQRWTMGLLRRLA
jgi:hypothetical protein